nr:universal stress protein MSMEG_3950/MSMEI_3859-like [Hydra vulgaris]XP_047123572.1 universal stress protein MSMEG_3950/MSMEI_3859-like [Hydra vulgaris]
MGCTRNNCVAIDKSNACRNAFNWYVANYHRPEDTVLLVHILKMSKISNINPEQELKKFHKSAQKAKEVVAAYETICEENEIKCLTVIENYSNCTGSSICDVASKHAADVIIVGKRNLSTLSRLTLGSTSKYILHHSSVPVVIISEEYSM